MSDSLGAERGVPEEGAAGMPEPDPSEPLSVVERLNAVVDCWPDPPSPQDLTMDDALAIYAALGRLIEKFDVWNRYAIATRDLWATTQQPADRERVRVRYTWGD